MMRVMKDSRLDGATGAAPGNGAVFASNSGTARPEDATFGPDGNLYIINYEPQTISQISGHLVGRRRSQFQTFIFWRTADRVGQLQVIVGHRIA